MITGVKAHPWVNVKRPIRVIDCWDYLNDVCFDGDMKRPVIKVIKGLKVQQKGKVYPCNGAYGYDNKLKIGHIWIDYDSDASPLVILLHEMCHQYLKEVLGIDHKVLEHGADWNNTFIEAFIKLERHVRVLQKKLHKRPASKLRKHQGSQQRAPEGDVEEAEKDRSLALVT